MRSLYESLGSGVSTPLYEEVGSIGTVGRDEGKSRPLCVVLCRKQKNF